jgi:hypothetical protein
MAPAQVVEDVDGEVDGSITNHSIADTRIVDTHPEDEEDANRLINEGND